MFREDGRLRETVFFDNKFHDLVVLGLWKNEYKPAKNQKNFLARE